MTERPHVRRHIVQTIEFAGKLVAPYLELALGGSLARENVQVTPLLLPCLEHPIQVQQVRLMKLLYQAIKRYARLAT